MKCIDVTLSQLFYSYSTNWLNPSWIHVKKTEKKKNWKGILGVHSLMPVTFTKIGVLKSLYDDISAVDNFFDQWDPSNATSKEEMCGL